MAQERSLQTYENYQKKWDKFEDQITEHFEKKELQHYMTKDAVNRAKIRKLKNYVAISSPVFMLDLIKRQSINGVTKKTISLAKSIDNDSDMLKNVQKSNKDLIAPKNKLKRS